MEEQDSTAAHQAWQRTEREEQDGPVVLHGGADREKSPAQPELGQNPASSLEGEWEDQFLSFLTMAVSLLSGQAPPQPSLKFRAMAFQASSKGSSDLQWWPRREGEMPYFLLQNGSTLRHVALRNVDLFLVHAWVAILWCPAGAWST